MNVVIFVKERSINMTPRLRKKQCCLHILQMKYDEFKKAFKKAKVPLYDSPVPVIDREKVL